MRRLKSGRWDWREQHKRSLEAATASWVVRELESEGHQIEDLWSPDYDRRRCPDLGSRPDLAMTLDGVPAALDVTMFATINGYTAAVRASSIRQTINTALSGLGDRRSILGLLTYDPPALLAVSKPERLRDTAAIADAFVTAVAAIRDVATSVPVGPDLPRWVGGAAVTVSRGDRKRRSVDVVVLPRSRNVAAQVDKFTSERVESKGGQMAEWGRGILVIVHGQDESATDVAEGFDRRDDCPWWRVYWTDAGGRAHLVATER